MPLNGYQKVCYRWFGHTAENVANERLKQDLERAHINMRAGAYISYVWMNTILSFVVATFVFLTLFVFVAPPIFMIILFIALPIFITFITYFLMMKYPAMRARSRGKKIDMHLPYALNFISAMSSAGITPTEIFKSLSKQRIYGEIREEALWIYRDVGLLGRDIISAIKTNIKRTPSEKFKEFLQGAIVTVQSGGSLKPYFMSKAEQYARENRIAQKQLIESLGIMAETYVTAAVAGVLIVIIIIPLLMIITGFKTSDLYFMYFFIFLIIPLIHIGFSVVLYNMSEKV